MNDYRTAITTADASFAARGITPVFDDSDWPQLADPEDFVCPSFKIRAADSSGERSSASVLIQRMYATRGYTSSPLPESRPPHLVTLVASDHNETIGTMTVGFDSLNGLLADELFGEEIDALRRTGREVCEFTKLAIDVSSQSRPVLAALFHVAYIYAHRIRGVDDLLIEVNPRHVRYYSSMLGFKVIGEKRMNRRVNAPAVLLSVPFDHVREAIAAFGGRPEMAAVERSLYPYVFSPREEAGVIGRLRARFCEAPQRAPVSAMRRSSIEAALMIPPACLSEARCA